MGRTYGQTARESRRSSARLPACTSAPTARRWRPSIASEDVHLIECATGAIHRIVSGQADHPRQTTIAFSPDSTRLATAVAGRAKGGDPDPVSIWETATGRRLATFPGRSEELENLHLYARRSIVADIEQVGRSSVAAGAGRRRQGPAACRSQGRGVVAGLFARRPHRGHRQRRLRARPDHQAVGHGDGPIDGAWQGGEGTVASLAFSPDGRLLASGHLEARDNVRIWDAATGRRLATLEGHTDRVRAVAFAPDGKSLATASSDGTVRLWDVASWRERNVLHGHADTVHAVAFSPDGKTLASAGNDGDVRLWDLQSIDDANFATPCSPQPVQPDGAGVRSRRQDARRGRRSGLDRPSGTSTGRHPSG